MLHCISVITNKPTDITTQDVTTQVHALLSEQNTQLAAEQVTIQEQGGNSAVGQDTPLHLYGRYRFPMSQHRSEIIDGLQQGLESHAEVNWFVIYYHKCDHDEPVEVNHSCSLSKIVSMGDVPDAITLI